MDILEGTSKILYPKELAFITKKGNKINLLQRQNNFYYCPYTWINNLE
jgi:hypothetical protein